jgi:hypothetical protein
LKWPHLRRPEPDARSFVQREAKGRKECLAIIANIPFDPQAANLTFMLVSRRYERASLIVTSNKPFSAWGRSSATTRPPQQ